MRKYVTLAKNKHPENLQALLAKAAPILWKGKASERTMCRNIEQAIEIMENPKLHEITTSMIDEYTQVLKAHLAPGTVNYKLVNLHRLLKFAHEREWIEKLPKFSYMSLHNERERVFTEDEVNSVLTWLRENDREKAADFFEVLYLTGMRSGELRTAKREALQGNWLVLKARDTKTKKSRRVPLTDRARELLEKRLPFEMSKYMITQPWNEARVALGYDEDPEFVPHVLRHTRATMSLSKTKNLAVVQKLLGHANIKTTLRYAKVLDEDLLAAV